jgi:hypothetical protein
MLDILYPVSEGWFIVVLDANRHEWLITSYTVTESIMLLRENTDKSAFLCQ